MRLLWSDGLSAYYRSVLVTDPHAKDFALFGDATRCLVPDEGLPNIIFYLALQEHTVCPHRPLLLSYGFDYTFLSYKQIASPRLKQ